MRADAVYDTTEDKKPSNRPRDPLRPAQYEPLRGTASSLEGVLITKWQTSGGAHDLHWLRTVQVEPDAHWVGPV